MNNLLDLDKQITLLINGVLPHNYFFDIFFSFFSLQGSSIIIWALIIFIITLLEEKHDKKFILYFFISFLTTALLVNVLLKNIFQRPRPLPNIKYEVVNKTCPKDYSFPSGHAATAFASAAVLSHFDKKRRWFYYLVAFLISLSRIYLGCHYLLDVVGGAVFGEIVTLGVIIIRSVFKFGRQ